MKKLKNHKNIERNALGTEICIWDRDSDSPFWKVGNKNKK